MKNSILAPSIIALALFLNGCNDNYSGNTSTASTPTITPTTPRSTTIPAQDYAISDFYQIDDNLNSPNQDAREMFLVLHYTALPLDETLKRFMDSSYGASSHYLVPELRQGQNFTVYSLVPENRRAWHAGVSYWQGNRNINASSIGIEIENLGFPSADETIPLMQRRWYPFSSKEQIEVLASVIKDITQRYNISPSRIIGHSDVAPGRKFDPGPLFPWEELYKQHNIGAWFDDDTANFYRTYSPWSGNISELQIKLALYGYDVPNNDTLDQATQNAVSAFQMHFYPEKYDGIPDTETVARLDALLEKYRGQARPKI